MRETPNFSLSKKNMSVSTASGDSDSSGVTLLKQSAFTVVQTSDTLQSTIVEENAVARTHPVLVLVERRCYPPNVMRYVTGIDVTLKLRKKTRKRLVETTIPTLSSAETTSTHVLFLPIPALASVSYRWSRTTMTSAFMVRRAPTMSVSGQVRHTLLKSANLSAGLVPTMTRVTTSTVMSGPNYCCRVSPVE